MSKEKNLTRLDANGEIITECCNVFRDRVTYITELPCGRYDMIVGYGPAIDRLHEFEKLGMEPEEIEKKLKDYKVAMNRVYGLANEKEALTKGYSVTVEEYCTRINEKNEEIEELREKNQCQAETIADLQKEIERLKNHDATVISLEVDLLKKENGRLRGDLFNVINGTAYYRLSEENKNLRHKLHEKTEEYGAKIIAMAEDCDKLQEEIKNKDNKIHDLIVTNMALRETRVPVMKHNQEIRDLKQKVANFEQTMKLLNDCIKERDEEIASLENDYHQVEDACDRKDEEIEALKEELYQREKTEMQLRSFTGLQSKTIKNLDECITNQSKKLKNNKQTIRFLNDECKRLEDKLERIDGVITED